MDESLLSNLRLSNKPLNISKTSENRDYVPAQQSTLACTHVAGYS